MKIHEVKCDGCRKKAKLTWNGDTWLIPDNWFALWSDDQAKILDVHLCDRCAPKSPKKEDTDHA